MNHGFTVDRETLPEGVIETHVSLFDDTNCGLRVEGKDIFSVQYHPEASPGPMDSHYLFERFAKSRDGAVGIATNAGPKPWKRRRPERTIIWSQILISSLGSPSD